VCWEVELRADGRLLLKLSPVRVYEVNSRTPLTDGLLQNLPCGYYVA